MERQKELEREIETLKNKDKAGEAASILDSVRVINGVKAISIKGAGRRCQGAQGFIRRLGSNSAQA